jgi:hypothetical protein
MGSEKRNKRKGFKRNTDSANGFVLPAFPFEPNPVSQGCGQHACTVYSTVHVPQFTFHIPRPTFYFYVSPRKVPRGPSSAVGGKSLSLLCVLRALSEAGEK